MTATATCKTAFRFSFILNFPLRGAVALCTALTGIFKLVFVKMFVNVLKIPMESY